MPYGGVTACNETPLFNGVPCSIQKKNMSSAITVKLPADVANRTLWTIFIPLSAGIPNGAIKDRDIIVDDLGIRYQTTADYWNSLGYALICERLEA